MNLGLREPCGKRMGGREDITSGKTCVVCAVCVPVSEQLKKATNDLKKAQADLAKSEAALRELFNAELLRTQVTTLTAFQSEFERR